MQKIMWMLLFVVCGQTYARDSASMRENKAVVLRDLLLQLDISYLRCVTNCDVTKMDEKIQNLWIQLRNFIPESKRLDSIFQKKATPGKWREARLALEDELSLTLMPASMLSQERGKALFDRHCSSCHGTTGNGDGVLASRMSQFKMKLNENHYADHLSPTMVYNMILTGIPGVPMYSFKDQVSDSDMWNISFYTQSLALPEINVALTSSGDKKSATFGIKEIARYNGKELRILGLSEEEIFRFRNIDVYKHGRTK
jgi:mono/diheme cytochrome c family protein